MIFGVSIAAAYVVVGLLTAALQVFLDHLEGKTILLDMTAAVVVCWPFLLPFFLAQLVVVAARACFRRMSPPKSLHPRGGRRP